jgi:hypothetical protein
MRRRRPAPPTWDEIIARVEDVGMPRPDSTSPRARAAVEFARALDRAYAEPADVLAAIEREVSEPATRDRLDEMIRQRHDERMELDELDDLEVPDERTRLERIVDVLPAIVAVLGVLALVLPLRLIPVELIIAVNTVVALLTVIGALAVTLRPSRRGGTWQAPILELALLDGALLVIGLIRILASDSAADSGVATIVGLSTQVVVVLALLVLAVAFRKRASLDQHHHDPNDDRSPEVVEYDRAVARIDELERAAEEDGPGLLRAALVMRDPIDARATRGGVVEAIRALYELDQIDDAEAEWMLREALG